MNRCEHERTEVRRRRSLGGAVCVQRQCLTCLQGVGKARSASDPSDQKRPWWDIIGRRRKPGTAKARKYQERLKDKTWRELRERILIRDNWTCRACGEPATEVAHVPPSVPIGVCQGAPAILSYCRWSSMNWKCDLYCYEDASGGWTTHVAANRRKEPPPDWDFLGDCPADEIGRKVWIDKLLENHQRSMEWLETHPDLVRIELPYAGESFNDRTLDDFEARLHELRQLGYVFPDDIFETIAWERAHPEGEVEW